MAPKPEAKAADPKTPAPAPAETGAAAPAGGAAASSASGKWVIVNGNFVDSGDNKIVYSQNPLTGQIVKLDPEAKDDMSKATVIAPEDYKFTHTPSENKAADVLSKGGVFPSNQTVRGADGKEYTIKVMKFSKAATIVTAGGSIPAGTLVACPDGVVLTGKKATKAILSDPFYNPVGVSNPQDPNVVLATADANGNYSRPAAAAKAAAAPAATTGAAPATAAAAPAAAATATTTSTAAAAPAASSAVVYDGFYDYGYDYTPYYYDYDY